MPIRHANLLAACVALFAVAFGAEAASPRLRQVTVGYNRSVRVGKWTPLRLILENSGPETEVVVVARGDASQAGSAGLITRATVRMPARSVRRHVMYLQAEPDERLTVELFERGQRVGREEVQQYYLSSRDTLILALSTAGEGFSCRQPEASLGTNPRLIFNNSTQFQDLPARLQGLDPVDVLLIGALPPEGLTSMQERAIADFVRSGCLLILTPGTTPACYEGTVLEHLSPVRVFGSRLVEDLPPLARAYGAIPEGKSRIGLVETAVISGEVLAEIDGLPLVVSKAEGSGRVVFVAFDLANVRLISWMGLHRVYRDIVELRGLPPKASDAPVARPAVESLHSSVGVSVLPRWALAACLAFNLGGLVCILVLMRGRREVAFGIMVLCAPIMALLINGIGAAASGVVEAAGSALTILRSGSGESRGGLAGFYALLSPVEAHCDIRFPSNPTIVPLGLPLSAGGQAKGFVVAEAVRAPVELMDEDAKWLHRLHVRPRAVSLFGANGLLTLPGAIEAVATFEPKGIRFRLTNRTGMRLSETIAVFNRNAASLGSLSPGRTVEVLLDGASAQGLMARYWSGPVRSRRELERDRIINALYAAPRPSDVYDTGAHVLAWLDGEPAQVAVEGLGRSLRFGGQTLWIVTAARSTGRGGTVLVPRGAAAMQIMDASRSVFADGSWVPIVRRLTTEVFFILPQEVRGLQAKRMEFFFRSNGGPLFATVEALNVSTGGWDLIVGERKNGEQVPARAERLRLELAHPQDYLDPTSGRVALRLSLSPGPGRTIPTAGRRPVIEELDIEIEGVLK